LLEPWSRAVAGDRLFDDQAKEVLWRQFWQVANYCGLEILTYVILANHFHVLVRVPEKTVVADAELLRRYPMLSPRPTRYQSARLEVIKQQLAVDGPEAQHWRCRHLAQMGDLSPFMKLVKQRFSVWFNRNHGRFGPLGVRFLTCPLKVAGRSWPAAARCRIVVALPSVGGKALGPEKLPLENHEWLNH
jgi:hypothetical protein